MLIKNRFKSKIKSHFLPKDLSHPQCICLVKVTMPSLFRRELIYSPSTQLLTLGFLPLPPQSLLLRSSFVALLHLDSGRTFCSLAAFLETSCWGLVSPARRGIFTVWFLPFLLSGAGVSPYPPSPRLFALTLFSCWWSR